MPLFWLSLAFLCGVILAARVRLPVQTWVICCALAVGLALLQFVLSRLLNQPRFTRLAAWVARLRAWITRIRPTWLKLPLPFFVLLAGLFAGAARYQAVQPILTPASIGWYNDRSVQYVLEGVLVEPADARDTYINLRIRVERMRLSSQTAFTPVQGLLLAQAPAGGEWHYGDRLSLEGSLETPPSDETFSYRDYLARQDVFSLMPRAAVNLLQHNQGNPVLAAIYALKERALKVIYQLYPDPEASLLVGILIGVDSGIPDKVSQAFKDTGTSHIIAISGFNMTI